MKQLAKLFRSQRHESATKPTPRPTSRRLATESLEKRELLASDLMAGHNYVIPEDVNRDFRVTPLDALQIINQISRNGGKGVDLTSVKRGEMDRFYDVSGDNRITALDALRVINRISKGEAVGELIEYRIQPRTATDTAFSATDFNPATRNLNVAVNQVFNLEVNYVDLRNRFGGDFGAFAVYTNILTSLPDALEPVLTETQTVSVSGRLADISGGSLRFNFAGTPGTTTTRTFSEFFGENGGPINNLGAVLNSLGFQSSQFRISEIILPNDPNSNTIDRSYQIRFTDPALANQNLADLVVTPIGLVDSVGAPVPITTSNDSIAPRNADNSINQAAVPLNINYDSRTYLGGQQFFATGNDSSGSFNSASGFFAVGAIGRIAESVPAASNGLPLIEPFDAFSIPVRVIRPVSNLQIRIGLPIDDNGNYIDPTFATLLYESTDAIPPDKVLINLTNDPEVATDGFGLINVTATGPVGSVTVVANNTTLAATEDTNAIVNVGPLTTVTGSAAAPVFTITTQPARGTVTITGTTATFVPAANDFTVAGAPLTFVYTATVGTTSDTGTITVNIAAVNDPPIFTNDAARSTPRNTVLTIPIAALLANDLPGPANETGTVTLAATPAPTATNGTVTVTGGNFVFTPTNNFTGAAVISYTISDGALTAVATLTVNITAPGAVVVVANNTTLAATEDTNATVNLTPLTTVTGSTVTPVFTITTQPARGTVTISGTTATLVPAANDFTVSGAPLTFVYIATVGTAFDTGTVTVNIAAINDAPIFTADPATSTPRNTAVTIPVAPLLANDRPGPANETGTVTLAATPAPTATNGTVTVTGGNFVFTPTNNFTGTAVISYTISDGALTSPATLTVNITAPATVVVANDSTLNFVEDGPAQTLALLPLTTVTNSTATPVFTIVTQPARGTLTLSGTSVTYLPAPDDFTTTSLTFVYRATVGSVSDTGTISVNISSVNDGPVVVADTVTAPRDIVTTFAPQVFLANDRPGPANEASQTLTVTAVSAISATVGTVALVNGQIVYTPEPGFMGTDRFQYTVSDGSLSATGVVTVNVVGGSTLTGMIFTDYLEGVENPVRDGVKDTDEPAMGGLTVRLTSAAADNVSGRPVEMVQLTDADGTYLFSNIVPGTYVVTFDVPDTVVPGRLVPTTGTTIVSSNSYRIVVGSGGDLALSGNNFTTFGTTGAGADNLDFLVSRYLRTNANNLNAGTAMFVFDSSGQQQFFQAGRGYEDAKYVEVALNDNRDAALLTVLNEDGSVRTSRLSKEEFTVGNDGRMIRLFGSANSIGTTVTEGGSLSSEFGQYRDTIDELIRTGAV